jgi:hypothetical protein
MKRLYLCLLVTAFAAPAAAQDATRPHQMVCVAIDEARDTFSSDDRRAALLLVGRQFELAGARVADRNCATRYSLAHIRLGGTITVILSGPDVQREALASGMDDLPAVYSQIVRAILTGSSVGAADVIDRSNVTAAQASPKRVQIDSFGYARLGYGAILGSGGTGSPAIGFGYRAEMDSFGLDISFLNQQVPSETYGSTGAMGSSLLKLEALYFMKPHANASAYFGGGASWGVTSLSSDSSHAGYSSWSGSGLQGELTAGYELPRASALRFFAQVDAALPFYRVTGRTITYPTSPGAPTTTVNGRRYSPSVALSIGMGWQRHRQ